MELSGCQIQEHQFTSALRGYNRGEVKAFIEICAKQMGALEERLRIAEVSASKSETELADLRAEINELLEDATEARRLIIEEAKAEAATIARQSAAMGGSGELLDAATRATAILSEAESAASLRLKDVEQLRNAAEDAATAIVRRAEETAALTQAEADRLLDKARMDTNSMREESASIQASIEAQLAEIRRILEAARSGSVDLEDLASAGISGASDSDLVIDLRHGETVAETQDTSG